MVSKNARLFLLLSLLAVVNANKFAVKIVPIANEGSDQGVKEEVKTFEFIDKVGSGASGIVVKAKCIEDNQIYAVKIATKDRKQLETECKAYRRSGLFPGILPVYWKGESSELEEPLNDGKISTNGFAIIMKFAKTTDLKTQLNPSEKLEVRSREAARFGTTIIQVLKHLKGKGIAHRDIKLENILVDDGEYVLGDFGLVQFMDEPTPEIAYAGTITYATVHALEVAIEGNEVKDPTKRTGSMSPKDDVGSLARAIAFYAIGAETLEPELSTFLRYRGIPNLKAVAVARKKFPEGFNIDPVLYGIVKELTDAAADKEKDVDYDYFHNKLSNFGS